MTTEVEERSGAVEMYSWHEGMDFNPVEKVILERRSVRRYQDRQVPEKLVRRVCEAGRFAPTAGNCQAFKFVVIRDPALIDEIERFVGRLCRITSFLLDWRSSPLGRAAWLLAQATARIVPNWLHPVPFGAVSLIAQGKLKVFHGAPTIVLVLIDKRGVGYPEKDAYICAQNIILAAHSLGLGTCWVGFAEMLKYSPAWRRRLGLRWPLGIGMGIALGYPQGQPDGMVARELHEIDWFEGGEKRTVY
ncbi:MAG: nitroreductase family protein [Actinobacteria bacterium]|nr:nitroreductase family protein [Actinomycetota bacterium]MBU1943006.1 nitroreductase family protein [Actinomycetota bacterium]MBU2687754.1 nitroreductase family protein [Actinomycetota bacterium]